MEENEVIKEKTDIKNSFIAKTFLWMFLGLFATGLIAVFTYLSGALSNVNVVSMLPVICIVEVVVVLVFAFLSHKMPPGVVAVLYFAYAIINGITFSTIFMVYSLESIVIIFIVSALAFGVFALLGYKTKIDLTRFSNIFFVALITGCIISVINLFLGNQMLDIIISWVMVVVFFGVTAYDIQKIKMWGESGAIAHDKLHIYGAMEIYLDFINIFIRLLAIFGRSRD